MPPADSSSLDLSHTVDVCVCTYRRPAVAQLLASLAKQDLPEGWRIRVIVADNDDTPSARDIVQSAFAEHQLEGTYLHAPARNISLARNACLDAATADFAAFIDDDEIARPDWLANLINRLKASGAGVVFGRVAAGLHAVLKSACPRSFGERQQHLEARSGAGIARFTTDDH
jgi:succinoglycan biosynthesis protein ExoM